MQKGGKGTVRGSGHAKRVWVNRKGEGSTGGEVRRPPPVQAG